MSQKHSYEQFVLRSGQVVDIHPTDHEITVGNMNRGHIAHIMSEGETEERVVLSKNVSADDDGDTNLPDGAEMLVLIPTNQKVSTLWFTIPKESYK